MTLDRIASSPKRRADRAGWAYEYYAGYSGAFVREAITTLGLSPGSLVLDPWNGRGTTTRICSEAGLASVGIDLNPTMVVVARAAAATAAEAAIGAAAVREAIGSLQDDAGVAWVDDPLGEWFCGDALSVLRNLERRLYARLDLGDPDRTLIAAADIGQLSATAAFAYTCLFSMFQDMLSPFSTSNPTWRRSPSPEERIAVLTVAGLEAFLESAVRKLLPVEQIEPFAASPILKVGSSEAIDLPNSSVDAVIGSPPYLSRLDYAMQTKAELALVGISAVAFRALRREMMGTTAVNHVHRSSSIDALPTVQRLLERINSHPAKASQSYYGKLASDYFAKLAQSISEVSRVLRGRGTGAIVVEDSYFKDIHLDLSAVVSEMANHNDLSVVSVSRFANQASFRTVNP